MYLPRIDDERTTLCNYIETQLDAIRASSYGLNDDQARHTPLRSILSISGIIKHSTWVMKQSLAGAGHSEHAQPAEAFSDSFTPTSEETLDNLLVTFDAVRGEYMTMCRESDLEAELPVGPMPWYRMNETRPAKLRYLYVHHVEEFARHTGHADIIREQLDGAKAVELLAAVEGLPANDFVTPWHA
ncbi:DUF664 domain-containing protein [Corynebacterium lubricantis]|uniref:mycothiol transferase n=1 Tax=Corynebacterium lubricantis TaxID=541095 RepID=UPI00035CFFD4|nr:DUF664 domain-containing protein [Corynebacterium lubricantis]